MLKEKAQPKNTETQALDMARQVLGSVKEMDLTAEQKKEVMALIEQARTEENAGNIANALKIYIKLQKILKDIAGSKKENSAKGEKDQLVADQLEMVDEAIEKIENDKDLVRIVKDAYISDLEYQKTIISQPPEEKIKILSEDDFELLAKTIHSEAEILNLISVLAKVHPEELFLIEKACDKSDNLLHLNVGIAGKPETEYIYTIAMENGYYGSREDSEISRWDMDMIEHRKTGEQLLASFIEMLNKWHRE